jgi:hypothetical protein
MTKIVRIDDEVHEELQMFRIKNKLKTLNAAVALLLRRP